jgi:mannosyl-glycoprotein endo-beta-N-acetylglucosaminidase
LQEKDPQNSAAVAGDRKYDVYMGIDVFGRNSFGGGQWTVCITIFAFILLRCSIFTNKKY